jgi:hypothetical protein
VVKDKNVEREFSQIKEGLKLNKARIIEFLKQRVGQDDWDLLEVDSPLESVDGEPGKVDLLFGTKGTKKKPQYIMVDISVPHLGVGQKYMLPAKGKAFQEERKVPAGRVKKAIILIRKGIDGVQALPARIRCPIIEVQLDKIVARRAEAVKAESNQEAGVKQQGSKERTQAPRDNSQKNQKNEAKKPEPVVFTNEMLNALREAMVYDYISTAHKRNQKYVVRGLWRWIDKEILDPNMHFFFGILSAIYQGRTGDILSQRFKSLEEMVENPENVVKAIFSRENPLFDDLKKDEERHTKAISKFMLCFAQTPPYEYLKSIFLKEFRTTGDGLKSRMNVYTTLQQLMERCGFVGEKEVFYPLEILDELKMFQGIMAGNYSKLRVDNASKKLKHLVPHVTWTADEVYRLRDGLARLLGVPAAEFNLNSYLPQAFHKDTRFAAEQGRDARGRQDAKQDAKQDSKPEAKQDGKPEARQEARPDGRAQGRQEAKAQEPRAQESMAQDKRPEGQQHDGKPRAARGGQEPQRAEQSEGRPSKIKEEKRQEADSTPIKSYKVADTEVQRDGMPRKTRKSEESSAYEAAMMAERSEPTYYGERKTKKLPLSLESDAAYEDSEEVQVEALEEKAVEEVREHERYENFELDLYGNEVPVRFGDCDESKHRFFESFGGHLEEDMDSLKMAIAMLNYEKERLARAARAPKVEKRVEIEDDFLPPLKNQVNRHMVNRGGGTAGMPTRRPSAPMGPRDGRDGRDNRDGRDSRDGARRKYNNNNNRDRQNSGRRYNNNNNNNKRSNYSKNRNSSAPRQGGA